MFTGLIQSTATVHSFDGKELILMALNRPWPDPIQTGESISVSGCCLTVESDDNSFLKFSLSPETLARTAREKWIPSARLNLERAVRAGDRLGGHIVQGHVDTTGSVQNVSQNGEFVEITISVPTKFQKYLVDKGSVTVDGVSLTIVQPLEAQFRLALIPETLSRTTLGSLHPGDEVNVEFDALAKHVEQLLKFPN